MPTNSSKLRKFNKIHDFLQFIFLFTLFALNVALNLFLILDTTGVIFAGSIIPPKYLPFYFKLVLYFVHFYIMSLFLSSCAFVVCFAIIYCFYVTLFYITELWLGQPIQKYLTSPNLRKSPETLKNTYRSFQVLHASTNALFGPYYLILNALFMISCVYINFVLIKYWKALQIHTKFPLIIGLILMLTIWSSVMEMGRFLNTRGSKVLKSWKRHKWNDKTTTKIMHKFGLSCKPLQLAYGTQFVIRKGSLFIFYRGIVKGTCRALLTMK